MKKISLLLGCILFLTSAMARESMGLDIGVGVKAGLNFNKVVASEWKDHFSTDPFAGFFAYLNKHRLGIQAEVLWTQNSITTDSTFYGLYKQYYNQLSDSMKAGTFRFSSISIPILLNIKLTPFLWLQGGPQYTANVATADQNHLLKSGVDIVKQGNYNLVGGLWVQLGNTHSLFHLNTGLRYITGVSNVNNLSTLTGNKNQWKNQMIQLHVGISY